MDAYFSFLMHSVVDKTQSESSEKRNQLEKALQGLPLWVYRRGFDSRLQLGHQYFLTKLHHVADILFSLHNSVRYSFSDELLGVTKEPLIQLSEKIILFFSALMKVCELKKLTEAVDDGEAQLQQLDRQFQRWLPVNGELMTMAEEDIQFYGVMYCLADLRQTLILLSQALR